MNSEYQAPHPDPHVFSGARGLNFGLSLHLYPYFVYYVRDLEGYGQTEIMHKIITKKSCTSPYVLAEVNHSILGQRNMFLTKGQLYMCIQGSFLLDWKHLNGYFCKQHFIRVCTVF